MKCVEIRLSKWLAEEIARFALERSRTILDCTVGGGGHSARLLEQFPEAELYGIDRDPEAVEAAGRRLETFRDRVRLRQGRFSQLGAFVALWGQEKFDYVVADVGMSSEQLTCPERGFSFLWEGPLDMGMESERQHLTGGPSVGKDRPGLVEKGAARLPCQTVPGEAQGLTVSDRFPHLAFPSCFSYIEAVLGRSWLKIKTESNNEPVHRHCWSVANGFHGKASFPHLAFPPCVSLLLFLY